MESSRSQLLADLSLKFPVYACKWYLTCVLSKNFISCLCTRKLRHQFLVSIIFFFFQKIRAFPNSNHFRTLDVNIWDRERNLDPRIGSRRRAVSSSTFWFWGKRFFSMEEWQGLAAACSFLAAPLAFAALSSPEGTSARFSAR